MVLCNRYIFVGTFWQNLKKILGTVFSQSLKNPEMTSNLPLKRSKNGQKRLKTAKKRQKIYLLHRTIFSPVKMKFWPFFGPKLKTAGPVRPSVCTYVRTYVTDYLRNRSKDFFEIWYEVGAQTSHATF